MMKKLKAFYVPFVHKGFLTNKDADYKIKGTAYYIYNNNTIYREFIQIDEANFRPTDVEMQKTKYYKQTSKALEVRKNILEKYQVASNLDKNETLKNNKSRLTLNKDMIKEVNKHLLNLNRVKRSIDIFTGSNSPGAKSFIKKTNIIYFKNYSIYNGSNFTNTIKEFFKYENIDSSINSINELELIEFDEFLKINDEFKMYFEKKNQFAILLNTYVPNDFLELRDEIKKKVLSIEKEYDELVENIKTKIQLFIYEKKDINDIVKVLRSYQKMLMLKEIEEYNDNECKANSIEHDKFPNCHHAHIVSVSELKKRPTFENLYAIADNYNCLLLSPNIHNLYDSNTLWFDENGEGHHKNNTELKIKIKKEWLNKKRIYYLKIKNNAV